MANNLFVSFDVHDAAREAPLILSAIEELGCAVRIFSNVWYVRSELEAEEAARRVWDIMQPEDRLLVIDASADRAATFNVAEPCLRSMLTHWHQELANARTECAAEPSRTLRRFEPTRQDLDRAS
jgi:hypothetical protein